MIFSAQSYASLAQLCLSVAITGHVEAASNSQPNNPERTSAPTMPLRFRMLPGGRRLHPSNKFPAGPQSEKKKDNFDKIEGGSRTPIEGQEVTIQLIAHDDTTGLVSNIGFSVKGDKSSWRPRISNNRLVLVNGNYVTDKVIVGNPNRFEIHVLNLDTDKYVQYSLEEDSSKVTRILKVVERDNAATIMVDYGFMNQDDAYLHVKYGSDDSQSSAWGDTPY
ncbi:hypothetical protein ENBRE01_0989 [Enteropsectra breve]|nr:hypothetical protein ENBRE01_0989 [Enteropsectra breve]